MEMEVVMMPPLAAVDFNFDSNCSSPYMTAPSSPQRFGNSFFFSAPASPTHISAFYRSSASSSKVFHQVNDSSDDGGKCHDNEDEDEGEEDFEFNFSGHLERTSLSAADELFDGGKIRPLKPTTTTTTTTGYDSESAPSTVSSSPLFEPRGRERVSESSSSRKGTRSLSPIRVSDILNEQEDSSKVSRSTITSTTKSYASSILSAISFSNKKWKLKDFLFRSASEGRATSPDPLSKFAVVSKKEIVDDDDDDDDVKNSSFRSTESSGGSVSRRRRRVSAHELHYTANRAVSEELKRKTFLPYKQGLLGGCLRFNPSNGVHETSSRGVGSLPRV